VRKKEEKRPQTQADSATIVELIRAVEELVSRRKKPEELEGIIAEARALAREWKDPHSAQNPKDRRPLFDDTTHNTTSLLAALAVALRRDHQLVEAIRRHFPNELEGLWLRSFFAAAPIWASTQPQPKSWQKYERNKRRRWRRSYFNSIEYQFGGGLETDLRKRPSALFRPDDSSYKPVLTSMQTCLDEIFAGETVNMQRLEDLFYGFERHRLAKLAKQTGIEIKAGRGGRIDYSAVCKIMDALLRRNSQSKRKKKAGRPPAPPWLNDGNLRSRVLRAIEARIQSIDNLLLSIVANEVDVSKLSDEQFRIVSTIFEHFREYRAWKRGIAELFLTVLRRRLLDSGKK
jgi:hypothetical protein